jgi:phosphatidylserine/phosphatidylglycerophosphate/cardiolipin synthase-like enzyme
MESGPVTRGYAKQLERETLAQGVKLVKCRNAVHGKFLAWDDDDLVITSLNWASASGSPDHPGGEIGIHVQSQGIADAALEAIATLVPEVNK